MEKSDLIKASSQYNKHVLNVMVMVKKLQIHVMTVMAKEKNRHLRKYQSQFLKVLMMEQELDQQAKERLGTEVEQQEIYTYLLMFILITYLKDQMKIYFLNFQFRSLMLPQELLLKFQLLMGVRLKLKFQMGLKMANNSD